ncbi:hypothetical protein COOONC_25093 [Cooperia oncophora]
MDNEDCDECSKACSETFCRLCLQYYCRLCYLKFHQTWETNTARRSHGYYTTEHSKASANKYSVKHSDGVLDRCTTTVDF